MFETYLKSILLGIVQGIAEFLPISSSGHLVIAESLLHWDASHNLVFDVLLHLGTLGAILIVYRRDLFQLAHRPRLCIAIVIGTLPAVVVGLSFKRFFEAAFGNPLLVGCCLLATSVLLLVGQRAERAHDNLDSLGYKQAFCIGLFQAFAILPGISRSGSTIVGGLLAGLDRQSSATFSFLLAIPAIGGAGFLTAVDAWSESAASGATTSSAAAYNWGPMIVGTLVAFLVGWVSLRVLLRLITQKRLHWFAGYCFIAGTATIIWQLTTP